MTTDTPSPAAAAPVAGKGVPVTATLDQEAEINGKAKSQFRNYAKGERPSVRLFYERKNIEQTYDQVLAKRAEWLRLEKCELSIWDALVELDKLVDDSDPDTESSQIVHALQCAERARQDGKPRWMQLALLIHDLGKLLVFWGEPQHWAVGDTQPVGCPFSEKVVYSEYFAQNPDAADPRFCSSETGIYERGCGLDNLVMTFGHDEYGYHVFKPYLPEEALYFVRFHSFYSWHHEGAYAWAMSDKDRRMLPILLEMNAYDLYTKNMDKPNVDELKPYYLELIAEFFPEKVKF